MNKRLSFFKFLDLLSACDTKPAASYGQDSNGIGGKGDGGEYVAWRCNTGHIAIFTPFIVLITNALDILEGQITLDMSRAVHGLSRNSPLQQQNLVHS